MCMISEKNEKDRWRERETIDSVYERTIDRCEFGRKNYFWRKLLSTWPYLTEKSFSLDSVFQAPSNDTTFTVSAWNYFFRSSWCLINWSIALDVNHDLQSFERHRILRRFQVINGRKIENGGLRNRCVVLLTYKRSFQREMDRSVFSTRCFLFPLLTGSIDQDRSCLDDVSWSTSVWADSNEEEKRWPMEYVISDEQAWIYWLSSRVLSTCWRIVCPISSVFRRSVELMAVVRIAHSCHTSICSIVCEAATS